MEDLSQVRPFITTGEIVKIAKVHPNTVAMWRLTKKVVPKDKIGASFLYDREEVMKFLEARKATRRTKKSGGEENG
jgi:hypothetical protein